MKQVIFGQIVHDDPEKHCWIKWFLYDKLPANFLGNIHLANTIIG